MDQSLRVRVLDYVIWGTHLAAMGLSAYVVGFAWVKGAWDYVALGSFGLAVSLGYGLFFRVHVMAAQGKKHRRTREGCGTYGKLRGLGSRWVVGPVLRGYRAVRGALAKGPGSA